MSKKKIMTVYLFIVVACSMLIIFYKEQVSRGDDKLVIPFDLIEIGGSMATYTYVDRYVDLYYFFALNNTSSREEVEGEIGKPNGVHFSTGFPYYEVYDGYIAIHYSKEDNKVREILLYSQYEVRGIIYLDESLEEPTESVPYVEEELLFVELFKDNKQELEALVTQIKSEKSFYIEESESEADENIVFSIFFDSEPLDDTDDPNWIKIYYTSGTFSSNYNSEIADCLNNNDELKEAFRIVEEKELLNNIYIDNGDYTFNVDRTHTSFNKIYSNDFIYSEDKGRIRLYKPIEGHWYMFVPLVQE